MGGMGGLITLHEHEPKSENAMCFGMLEPWRIWQRFVKVWKHQQRFSPCQIRVQEAVKKWLTLAGTGTALRCVGTFALSRTAKRPPLRLAPSLKSTV